MILQLRHTTFTTQSLKEIHSGRETGLIDTGPLPTAQQGLFKRSNCINRLLIGKLSTVAFDKTMTSIGILQKRIYMVVLQMVKCPLILFKYNKELGDNSNIGFAVIKDSF